MIGNIYHELSKQYKQLINESKRKVNDNYINMAYNKCKASWSMVINLSSKSSKDKVYYEKYFSPNDFNIDSMIPLKQLTANN